MSSQGDGEREGREHEKLNATQSSGCDFFPSPTATLLAQTIPCLLKHTLTKYFLIFEKTCGQARNKESELVRANEGKSSQERRRGRAEIKFRVIDFARA